MQKYQDLHSHLSSMCTCTHTHTHTHTRVYYTHTTHAHSHTNAHTTHTYKHTYYTHTHANTTHTHTNTHYPPPPHYSEQQQEGSMLVGHHLPHSVTSLSLKTLTGVVLPTPWYSQTHLHNTVRAIFMAGTLGKYGPLLGNYRLSR